MPQPVPFSRTFFWSNWSQWLRDLGPPSVLDYPPSQKSPMFQMFFEPSILVIPRPTAFTKTFFLVELVPMAQRSRFSKCAQLYAQE